MAGGEIVLASAAKRTSCSAKATWSVEAPLIWPPMAVPLVNAHHNWRFPSDLPLRLLTFSVASKLPSAVAPNQILLSAVASLRFMQVAASALLPVTSTPTAPAQSAPASRAGS